MYLDWEGKSRGAYVSGGGNGEFGNQQQLSYLLTLIALLHSQAQNLKSC
jgi:hypothetical protein